MLTNLGPQMTEINIEQLEQLLKKLFDRVNEKHGETSAREQKEFMSLPDSTKY